VKITGVSVSACRLPPATPWEDATNRVEALEFLVVRLEAGGETGVGFSYTVDVGGTAMLALARDYLAPLVEGMDPRNPEQIWARLSRQSRRLGAGVNSMCVAAFDIAVWDLLGKLRGEPLWRMIGGARARVPAYVSEIRLGTEDIADLEARLDDYLARGYRGVKIKIGRPDFAEDIARLEAATRMLDRRARLFVDLNQKWTLAEALVRAPELDRFGLGWIEEPLSYTDVAGHGRLRAAIRTPLAAGESLHARHQVLAYLEGGALDFIQADVAFVGGVTEWLKLAHLAEIHGRPVAPHYMMELSLQLLCGVPNAFMLEDVVGGSFTELGLLATPIRVENGVGVPPDRPGHGIEFDFDALARHEIAAQLRERPFTGGSK
jgi:L-alanine-DL-glutamate epimerase-like enolase superfamily enzyme